MGGAKLFQQRFDLLTVGICLLSSGPVGAQAQQFQLGEPQLTSPVLLNTLPIALQIEVKRLA